jgi:hypothetical protein
LRQRRTFGRRFPKVRGSIYSHLRPAHFRQRCVASATPESGRDACLAQVTGNRYAVPSLGKRSLTQT